MTMKSARAIPMKHCPVLSETCIAMLFGLMILCGSFFLLARPAFAAGIPATNPSRPLTGYCSNPAPHCYATRDWVGYTGGASVLIDPYGALSCFGCGGFVDDEMWFTGDNNFSQVEVGISTWTASNPNSCDQGFDSTCAFWADDRTNGGGHHEHPLFFFGPDGEDLTPYLFYASIVNNTSLLSNGYTWVIETSLYANGAFIGNEDGVSTNNIMNGHDIRIGSELSDSGGSAGAFYFQDNQWMDGGGNWVYQTTAGSNSSTGAPPNGYWSTSPCNCSGNTGGAFITYD